MDNLYFLRIKFAEEITQNQLRELGVSVLNIRINSEQENETVVIRTSSYAELLDTARIFLNSDRRVIELRLEPASVRAPKRRR